MSGKLYVVGTPIGNLGDFSPRAAETLEKVDFIAAEDTRVSVKLLNHFGIKKPMISYHEHNKIARREEIAERISIPAGGDAFCSAIQEYVAKKHRLRVNFRMAEEIKRQIGTVWVDGERNSTETMGLDRDNNWKQVLLSSDEMFTALEEPCSAILEAVCNAAAKIPLDDIEGALHSGILLTGGGSHLRGIKQMIEGITGFKCIVPKKPEDAVSLGLANLLPELPRKMSGPNISTIAVKSYSFRD